MIQRNIREREYKMSKCKGRFVSDKGLLLLIITWLVIFGGIAVWAILNHLGF